MSHDHRRPPTTAQPQLCDGQVQEAIHKEKGGDTHTRHAARRNNSNRPLEARGIASNLGLEGSMSEQR
jgi:hypothetical protein